MEKKELTEGQREVLSQLLHITLTGKGDAEEVGRLCGRMFELLTPAQRRELELSMAVHRATLMLGALREMGYVA